MPRTINCLFVAFCLLSFSAPGLAGERYYYLPVNDLHLTEGAMVVEPSDGEEATQPFGRRDRWLRQLQKPFAVGRHDEEIYIVLKGESGRWDPARSLDANLDAARIAIRACESAQPQGTLYVPGPNSSNLMKIGFNVPEGSPAAESARNHFLRAKEDYYATLLRLHPPGAVWLRHEMLAARESRVGAAQASSERRRPARETFDTELQQTFDLYTGGRAISENLQLDRELILFSDLSALQVPIDSIEGITIAALDWQELLKGKSPEKDAIAKALPFDQHALIFPGFQALVDMLDEAKARGTPILRILETRSEDAQTLERYEQQLCLPLDAVARLIGPSLVTSSALTGSDPYLRTGSDVAVVFETSKPRALEAMLRARHALARKAVDGTKIEYGTIAGDLPYAGVISPRRRICSYIATIDDDLVVVSNSLFQLERIHHTAQGQMQSLDELDEYAFFRDRYAKDAPDETAFLMVSDATIRRWCSPRWRIGASRRTRAAALLMNLQAENLDALRDGIETPRKIDLQKPVALLDDLFIDASGVYSATFGSLDFLTPIAELQIDRVSQEEKDAYLRFQRNYERHWRQYYDPIAARFSIESGRLGLDLTVMPVTAFSEYRDFMVLTGNAAIEPGAGDLHPEAVLHFVMSLDQDSPQVRQFSNFAASIFPGKRSASPLSWIGRWLALYADEDPFWSELGEAAERGGENEMADYMEANLARLPLALHVDVANPFKMSAFLTALRAFVEQTSPGLTRWESLKHDDLPYVKIAPGSESEMYWRDNQDTFKDLALYYAPLPHALIVTLNEDLIKRALTRQRAWIDAQKQDDHGTHEPSPEPQASLLGKSVAVHAERFALDVLQGIFNEDLQTIMQRRSFTNIVILNEWRRRFGVQDPLAFQQRYWQTRLVCPSGGDYVWNEEYRTMESTVYGHPWKPRQHREQTTPLSHLAGASFGLTFENDGLRAKVSVDVKE